MTTHPQFNTKSPTIKRILKEATELSTHPSPDHHATPLESNLFEWHFTLRGPPSPSPYASGIYHGRIILPPTYPLRPPSFRFLTPSGRFEVNREICLSISGHHEETWQPAWGIRTALVAIRSFMDSEARGQVGGLEAGVQARRALAGESGGWRCAGCGGRTNREILEEGVDGAGVREELGEEVQVPRELRLAYRDEMGKEGEGERTGTGRRLGTAEEAEAGSETKSPAPDANSLAQPGSADSLPPPTRTIPAQAQLQLNQTQPQPQPPPQAPNRNRNRPTDSAVPAWIDRAIVGVAISLAILVLRRLVYL